MRPTVNKVKKKMRPMPFKNRPNGEIAPNLVTLTALVTLLIDIDRERARPFTLATDLNK